MNRAAIEDAIHTTRRVMRAELALALGRDHSSPHDNKLETWDSLLERVGKLYKASGSPPLRNASSRRRRRMRSRTAARHVKP